jgi:hypothetical protein
MSLDSVIMRKSTDRTKMKGKMMATLEEIDIEGTAIHYAYSVVYTLADKANQLVAIDATDKEKLSGMAILLLTAEAVLREKLHNLAVDYRDVKAEVDGLNIILNTLPEED